MFWAGTEDLGRHLVWEQRWLVHFEGREEAGSLQRSVQAACLALLSLINSAVSERKLEAGWIYRDTCLHSSYLKD